MGKRFKKVLSAVLAAAGRIFAQRAGVLTYKIENGEVTITDCDESASGKLVIPDTIKGKPVTSIGDEAFRNCTSLTSVTIPDGITKIASSTFSGCSSLTSITIPDSVTSIGGWAFSDTGIYNDENNWENGVLYIGNHLIKAKSDIVSGDYTIKAGTKIIADKAFYYCTSLTAITVGKNNPGYCDIDGVLFNKDKTILIQYPAGKTATKYTIPDGVTSIGGCAFWHCTSLTSVTIPDSVTSIGGYAFYDCTNLTSVKIGNGVTSIDKSAFYLCSSLTSVTIPDGVKSIGDCAFYYCESLTSVTIPDGVTSIGDGAFHGCTGLTNVTIPDSVTSIGMLAFQACWSLTSVTIPDSVTSIGDRAFYYCSSLTAITVNKNNPGYCDIDGVLFNKDKTVLIQYPIGNARTAYTIPDGVTSIGYCAFAGCKSLTSVTIPDGVTSIGDGAFQWCDSLTSVMIPDSVTSIGAHAFVYCTSLTSITIPDGVTKIGDYAFDDCYALTDVYYGGSKSDWGYILRTLSPSYDRDFININSLLDANIHYDSPPRLRKAYSERAGTRKSPKAPTEGSAEKTRAAKKEN